MEEAHQQSVNFAATQIESKSNHRTLESMKIDETLVMKCLANNVALQSKYTVSLFDFGGQSVFNVIHPFFLTRFGIYVVVFNMEWLIGDSGMCCQKISIIRR